MKVSILVPIYGVEKSIKKCAISLFEQTYSNIEYIFVNDCTKDASIDILQNVLNNYPHRKATTKIINHTHNQGLSTARNTALKNATGDYIMHVDSDDYIDYNTVEKCMNKIGTSDVIIFGARHYNKKGSFIKDVKIITNAEEYIKAILERKIPSNIWGGIYKRNLYTDNNIYAIDGIFMGEDFVTKPRLLYYAKQITFLNEPLYHYSSPESRNIKDKDVIDLAKCISILKSFFLSKKDSYIYIESLRKAETLTKITSIIQWGLSKTAQKNVFNTIVNEFPPERDINVDNFNRKIIIFLASKKINFLLKYYIRIAYQFR